MAKADDTIENRVYLFDSLASSYVSAASDLLPACCPVRRGLRTAGRFRGKFPSTPPASDGRSGPGSRSSSRSLPLVLIDAISHGFEDERAAVPQLRGGSGVVCCVTGYRLRCSRPLRP